MTQVNIPYVFQNQTTADANQVDQNFSAITSVVNGNLDDSNMKTGSLTGASIATEGVTPTKTKGVPYSTDLYGSTGFVQSGLAVTKDGTNLNQVNLAVGIAHLVQADGTLRRLSLAATNFKTVSASATYYLDLNPDGTWSWATGHSAQANYLTIATVTSDGSSNVNVITDTRTFGGVQSAGAVRVGSTVYNASLTATANSLPLRDANSNVIVALPTANGQNPNLLFNPSARLGLTGWSVGQGSAWSAVFGTNGEGGYFQSPTVTAGSYYTFLSTAIPCAANQTLTLSAEISTLGLTAGIAYVDIVYYNSSNTYLSESATATLSFGSNFTKVSLTASAPANTDHIKVQLVLSNTAAGYAQFRKIKVEQGSIVTTFSDDNSFNTTQYNSVLPFASTDGSGNFNNAPTIQSIAGPSAGTLYYIQDMRGTGKRYIGYFSNLTTSSTAWTVNFPVAFTKGAAQYNSAGLSGSLTFTATGFTIAANTASVTGTIVFEGM